MVTLLFQCTRNDEFTGEKGYLVREATLTYQLTVDGCDWHFVVEEDEQSKQWVASSASNPVIQKFISQQPAFSQVEVIITYKLTGATRSVTCGWNTTTQMPEIELAAIKKR